MMDAKFTGNWKDLILYLRHADYSYFIRYDRVEILSGDLLLTLRRA